MKGLYVYDNATSLIFHAISSGGLSASSAGARAGRRSDFPCASPPRRTGVAGLRSCIPLRVFSDPTRREIRAERRSRRPRGSGALSGSSGAQLEDRPCHHLSHRRLLLPRSYGRTLPASRSRRDEMARPLSVAMVRLGSLPDRDGVSGGGPDCASAPSFCSSRSAGKLNAKEGDREIFDPAAYLSCFCYRHGGAPLIGRARRFVLQVDQPIDPARRVADCRVIIVESDRPSLEKAQPHREADHHHSPHVLRQSYAVPSVAIFLYRLPWPSPR